MQVWKNYNGDVSYFKDNNGNYLVKQKLGELSLYSFEGSFDKAIAFLTAKKEEYPVGKPISANYFIYIDDLEERPWNWKRGENREFCFDEINIEEETYYFSEDSSSPLIIVGIRKPTEKELECVKQHEEKEKQKRNDYELQEFHRLKRKFVNDKED